MLLIILSVIVFWLIYGVFAYGLTFAYFQRKYPTIAEMERKEDRNFAIKMGFCGLIGFLAALPYSKFGKYGLKWR